MKDIIKKVKSMAMVFIHGLMVLNIKEIGKIIKLVVLVISFK